MVTTIRINEDVKQQLKLKSVETGISQINLANRYIIEGIKNDTTPKKSIKTVKEIERILGHDKRKVKKDTLINFDEDISDNLKLNDNNELNNPITNLDEIKKLLDHDKPEGSSILEELDGAVHSDDVSNSVELKKNVYK